MEIVYATGKTKAIGVANYSLTYLRELSTTAKIMPAVNQIENHPLLPQQEIIDYCDGKGIHVTAYSPLGSAGSPLLEFPIIRQLAKQRGVAPSAVLLGWHGKIYDSKKPTV